MIDTLVTLDEKIEKLKDESEAQLKADIADYDILLGDNKVSQLALANVKKEFKNIKPSSLYEVGYYNIENLSIVDIDSGVNYKHGFDFSTNYVWGMIEILPNGTIKKGVNIVVNFDVKECLYESMSVGIAFIEHKGKPRDEIIALKKEAEAKLNDSCKMHPAGYPYFNDVCYLSDEQKSEYENECEAYTFDSDDIFYTVNYLTYLYWYIRTLKRSQKNVKRSRAIAPPVNEIISILKFIDNEDDAVEPLIRLLATFEGDYSSKIISHNNRIAYKAEKETAQPMQPPKLNIDKLSELKTEYKEKKKEVYTLMKRQNSRRYKEPSKKLLKALNLPLTPSDI